MSGFRVNVTLLKHTSLLSPPASMADITNQWQHSLLLSTVALRQLSAQHSRQHSQVMRRWSLFLSLLVKGSEDSWCLSLGSLAFPQTQHAYLHLWFIACQVFVLRSSSFCFFKAELFLEAWLTFHLLPRGFSIPQALFSPPVLPFPIAVFWYHSMDPCPKSSSELLFPPLLDFKSLRSFKLLKIFTEKKSYT